MFRLLRYFIIFQMLIISIPIKCNPLSVAESHNKFQSNLHGRKPIWSPDGGLIAFVSESSGNSDIWTIEPNGTNPRNLTAANLEPDDSPVWSPDGVQIAFASEQTGKSDIWVMQFDGTHAVNLTANLAGNHSTPAWSPNGRFIAFKTETVPFLSFDVWGMESNGANPVRLTSEENHFYDSITWSPDSRNLAFTNVISDPTSPAQFRFDGVMVATIADKALNSLTSKRHDVDVAWSPQGNLLALTTQESSFVSDIWLIAPDGSSLTNLTAFRSGSNYLPVWSPDGSRIAFRSHRDEAPPPRDIWVINADGSNPISLTGDIGFSNVDPAWSPDGKQIAFASYLSTYDAESDTDIWIINVDGSNARDLTVGIPQ